MKFFNYDSPFWSFMSRIADLVIVNILWLVFCIPVFTIGASTAAMYRVTLNMVRGEGGGVVRSFWASFKLNFKQGVLLFLILLIPTLLVIVEVEIYLSGCGGAVDLDGCGLLPPGTARFADRCLYLSPAGAVRQYHQEHTQKRHSAFDRQPPYSLVMAALNLAVPLLLLFATSFFLRTCIFWLLIGGALIAMLNSYLLRKIFKKYFELD